MRLTLWPVCLAAMAMLSSAAEAQDIGLAERIVNTVTASERSLSQGAGVRQNEVVAAAADSLGELRFIDNSRIAVGPGASLRLDTFVYDPERSRGNIAVELTKGAFRFITGRASKPSYLIKSQTASISVRGTTFDAYVEANGTIWILLHEGALEVCSTRRECRVLDDPCSIIRVGPDNVMTGQSKWTGLPAVREIDFSTAFPFVVSPPGIDPQPLYTRVNVETGQCAARRMEPPAEQRTEAPAYTPAPALPPAPPAPPPAPGIAVAPSVPAPATQPAPVEAYEPLPAPYVSPAAAAALTQSPRWSGGYIGVSAGAAYMPGDTHVGCDDPAGIFDTVFNTPNCAFPILSGALETNYSTEAAGFIGGVQVGYNLQTGNFLLGFEVDFSGTSIDGDDRAEKNVPPTSPGVRRLDHDVEWLSTLRARLGYATGDWLFYGTAGLAFGEVEYRYDAQYSGGVAFASFHEREIEVGWTAGVGAEVSLGGWSIKGEYLYYDLGTAEFDTQFFQAGVPVDVFFEPEFENKGHILRLGINYRLD